MRNLPSEEKIWLNHYEQNAFQKASNYKKNMTLWDYIEHRLEDFESIPALKYFGTIVSRQSFIDQVYLWAKALRTIGVAENDVVLIYSPLLPEIAYITFALNMVGACACFLKLNIDETSFRAETRECRHAIVFDDFLEGIKSALDQSQFEKVIVVQTTDSMPLIAKYIVRPKRQRGKGSPRGEKYLSTKVALGYANDFSGTLRAPFVKDRNSFITYSSGTTVNGIVKGVIATNETAICQLFQAAYADAGYRPGALCLNNLPPTASTSLNVLLFQALSFGMTVVLDPRFEADLFYSQIMSNKPQVALATGSFWEAFFQRIDELSKKPDLSFLELAIIGGEGVIPEDLDWMSRIMEECNAPWPVVTGSGQSEAFAVISIHKHGISKKRDKQSRPVTDVGIPYPGITVGIFDEDGHELQYGQRGELWIRSDATMKGYYGKESLTKTTIVDGWLRTGDIYEIDADGLLYLYGRKADRLMTDGNQPVYLFDIEHKIRSDEAIKCCIINSMPLVDGSAVLAVHIILDDGFSGDPSSVLFKLNEITAPLLSGVRVVLAYKIHEGAFEPSSTTGKKDRNKLLQELTGYFRIVDGVIQGSEFVQDGSNGRYFFYERLGACE